MNWVREALTVFVAIAMLAIVCFVDSARGNTRSPAAILNTNAAAPVAPSSTDQRSVQSRITALDERVANMEKQSDRLFVVLTVFGGLFSLMSVFGVGVSILRSGEAHKLSMAGERAGQSRAADVHESFLSGSKNTLSLVNETLALAKDASERAAKVIQERAQTNLEQIDRDARNLIKPSANDRRIIETQAARADLQSVSQKIAMFETNSFMFPTELPLTPACLFIRGLAFHLEQQYDDALEYWNRAAMSQVSTAEIKTLSWYWTGYVQNNRGHYSDAEDAFSQSLDSAVGSRRHELRRIALETRFFNKPQFKARSLIEPLEALLAQAQQDNGGEYIEDRVAKISTTLANVLLRHSFESDLSEAEKLTARERAGSLYASVRLREKWAIFGMAETLLATGLVDQARELYRNDILSLAENEHLTRAEPRTKVLARTTELICCYRVPDLRSRVESVYGDLRGVLGQLDDGVTVFSQFQLRNVMKSQFVEELAAFVAREEDLAVAQ